MRVLGLCSYPIEAAATRYRLAQFVEPLAEKGIELKISSFLDSGQFTLLYQNKARQQVLAGLAKSTMRRAAEIFAAKRFDVLFVQREAMFFGPAFFEWAVRSFGGLPMILDLDDATYIRYTSPTYGKLGSALKFFGKTDNLIERAATVVCGNRIIAEYVRAKGSKAVVVPTVVDTDKFFPVEKKNEIPVIGWIGTHSTFPLLESIFPALRKLSEKHRFVLKIVGAGREDVRLENVTIENTTWRLESETADFQSLDIGLYPIAVSRSASSDWLLGKSGFKAIQYLAVGIPFVMTPIGVCAEIGEPNRTHFNAETAEDWYNALDKLLSDADLRKKMGAAARRHSLTHYAVARQTEKLAETFEDVYRSRRK